MTEAADGPGSPGTASPWIPGDRILMPEIAPSRNWLAKLPALRLSMPKISLAKLRVLKIFVPNFSVPNFSVPKLSVPKLSLARFSLAKVSVPRISVPRISVPRISVPRISVSSVSVPSVSVPSVSVPGISLAKLAPPKIWMANIALAKTYLAKSSLANIPKISVAGMSLGGIGAGATRLATAALHRGRGVTEEAVRRFAGWPLRARVTAAALAVLWIPALALGWWMLGAAPAAAPEAAADAPEAVIADAPRLPAPVMPPVAAAVVRPPLPPTRPAWLRYAVAAPPIDGRPRIAVVIDDLGVDKRRTQRVIGFAPPLTLSFLPSAPDLTKQTEAARQAGHELLLHVPMEPLDPAIDAGPTMLATEQPPDEVRRRLRWALDRFPGYVGINNHMGSKFTSDAPHMTLVIEELHERGLLFLDSRTTPGTIGAGLARHLGVPNASRDVFLDNDLAPLAIAARLRDLEVVARRQGTAIAIGHPHEATLSALAAWLGALRGRGMVLVPLSAVVKQRLAAG